MKDVDLKMITAWQNPPGKRRTPCQTSLGNEVESHFFSANSKPPRIGRRPIDTSQMT
jgi:hypothetical protein